MTLSYLKKAIKAFIDLFNSILKYFLALICNLQIALIQFFEAIL